MPDRRFAGLAAAAVVAVAAATGAAFAQDAGGGHGRGAEVELSSLSPEQRAFALDVWAHIYCACEHENWSRTLSNCPDGCAVPQKQQVLQRVAAGWDLDRIVAEQVKQYGPRAAADPGSGANGTLFVLAGLVAGAGVAAGVLSAWRRGAAQRREAAQAARESAPTDAAESDAVERELREID